MPDYLTLFLEKRMMECLKNLRRKTMSMKNGKPDFDTTIEITKEIMQILKNHNLSEYEAKKLCFFAHSAVELTEGWSPEKGGE